MSLSVYQNETDCLIAKSEEDAKLVWYEHFGTWYEDGFCPFELLPPDAAVYHLREDITRTAAEWVRLKGRCLLFSDMDH